MFIFYVVWPLARGLLSIGGQTVSLHDAHRYTGVVKPEWMLSELYWTIVITLCANTTCKTTAPHQSITHHLYTIFPL